MVKKPTAATAEKETLGTEELTEGATLSQTGKSINIPGSSCSSSCTSIEPKTEVGRIYNWVL
jgi:hypothetical protein